MIKTAVRCSGGCGSASQTSIRTRALSLDNRRRRAAYAVAVRAATELLTSGTYHSVAGGIAYDTMNDAVTAAPGLPS